MGQIYMNFTGRQLQSQMQGSLESYRPSKKTYINAGRFAYDVFERFQNKLETGCDLGS